jgi:hypothetical protein
VSEVYTCIYLSVGDWAEAFLLEFLIGLSVVPQVEFGTDQDDGSVGTVVAHLWEPLSSSSRKEGGESKGGRDTETMDGYATFHIQLSFLMYNCNKDFPMLHGIVPSNI